MCKRIKRNRCFLALAGVFFLVVARAEIARGAPPVAAPAQVPPPATETLALVSDLQIIEFATPLLQGLLANKSLSLAADSVSIKERRSISDTWEGREAKRDLLADSISGAVSAAADKWKGIAGLGGSDVRADGASEEIALSALSASYALDASALELFAVNFRAISGNGPTSTGFIYILAGRLGKATEFIANAGVRPYLSLATTDRDSAPIVLDAINVGNRWSRSPPPAFGANPDLHLDMGSASRH
jgi:hypothetical protein